MEALEIVILAALGLAPFIRMLVRQGVSVREELTALAQAGTKDDQGGRAAMPDSKRGDTGTSNRESGEEYYFVMTWAEQGLPAAGWIVAATALLSLLLLHFFHGAGVGQLIAVALAGLLCGSAVLRARRRRARAALSRSIEFYLPIVMERMVMAVQAGLDIVPAMRTAVFQARPRCVDSRPDPVSRLLRTVLALTERGVTLEQSLREVASRVDCTALRHAFIHLAIAQREGGEIVYPLKELSDSTQLYYQDSIEEEIARLPVKATMPLLCIFAGLVICFITSPVIQVLNMTLKAMPE